MSPKKLAVLLLSTLLVIGSVVAGGCLQNDVSTPPGQETPTQIIENITPEEAFTLIQDNQGNPNFVILDVRTPQEFADGYVANATNIDFYSATFEDELDALDKEKTYLIYCKSGGRSSQALGIMDELGFQEVYNLSGGISAWQDAGLPTVE